MKICVDCKKEKDESEFSRKGTGFQCRCKECFATYHKKYYAINKEKYFAKNRKNKTRQRTRLKEILRSAKDCPCQDCGEKYHPWVMEFDHREETVKINNVSSLATRGCTDEKLLAEIKKCEVVCANCHRMRTYNRRQIKIIT